MTITKDELSKNSLDPNKMLQSAQQTTAFLKSMAHTSRLMILCRLTEKPASVSELERFLDIPQAEVSKQLARLRKEGFVKATRNGRSIIYSISDIRARILVDTLYDLFCTDSFQD